MKRLLLLLCLGVVQAETVIRTAPIPNRLLRQGDAILMASEDGTRFVRIALHTRHLDRVEAKIIEGETRNWPDSADSAAYIEALRRVCREARAATSGAVRLQIDWMPGQVLLSQGGSSQIVANLSPEYRRENLILIVSDRFGLTPKQAEELIFP